MVKGLFLLSRGVVLHDNVFYSMVPKWLLGPEVVLATLATIIASQALISGAFSLVAQAISLGLLPKIKVIHTHEHHEGQIYVPTVNWALLIGCIILVLVFQSSSRLAGAYGLAVSGVMLITSINMIAVARYQWHWSRQKALAIFVPLTLIDTMFFTANSLKIIEGGIIPLSIGVFFLFAVQSWVWGRRKINNTFDSYPSLKIKELLELRSSVNNFLEKTVIIMTPDFVMSEEDNVPLVKQVFWDKYGLFPRHLVFLNIADSDTAHSHENRYEVKNYLNLGNDGSVQAVTVNFGFMEEPKVENILDELASKHLAHIDAKHTDWIIHVVHERMISVKHPRNIYKRLRRALFIFMAGNVKTADQFFGLGNDVQLTINIVPVKV
ncbi:MAG: KUP/HAK/KT family potassium transporter [Patescibacteria group bacterium]